MPQKPAGSRSLDCYRHRSLGQFALGADIAIGLSSEPMPTHLFHTGPPSANVDRPGRSSALLTGTPSARRVTIPSVPHTRDDSISSTGRQCPAQRLPPAHPRVLDVSGAFAHCPDWTDGCARSQCELGDLFLRKTRLTYIQGTSKPIPSSSTSSFDASVSNLLFPL